jgi:hypothetical protein
MKNFTKFIATLLASTVILFSIGAKAQNSFGVGTSAINLGVGFGYSFGYYGSSVSSTPVISGSYEYGAVRLGPGTLGLGVQIGYQGASYSYSEYDPYYYYYYGIPGGTYTYSYTWTTTLFGIRGMYHPDFVNGKKYDLYAGIQLSYDHVSSSFSTNDPYYSQYGGVANSSVGSSFYPYIIIGGRYYFTDNIGVWAELGYSLAYLNLGLSIKFGGSGGGK